jgi:2-succinyl-6-hydroxy-2,4-cyclohexadiene-1-carboxylate synthase
VTRRPLLLLHGFTGSPRSWEGIAPDPDAVELIAPALVGHRDAADRGVSGFEAEVDRIAGLADGRARLHVAGYSLGGRIALGLLVRHPHLTTSATLIGAHPGLATEAERHARQEADEAWCRTLEQRGLRAFVEAWEAQPLFATRAYLQPRRLAAWHRDRLGHEAPGLVRSLRTTGLGRMPDHGEDLARIKVPVRLMVGEHDHKFRTLAERMARVLPCATLEVVPGAGHNLLIERPERVAAVLEEESAR